MNEIGFTGTRNGMTDKQISTVKLLLSNIECEVVHHGDCVGSDENFHHIAKSLGKKIIIHPPIDDKLRAYCRGDVYCRCKSYLTRNRDIVDRSSVLIATPKENSEQSKGGTWYTVRYAIQNRILVNIVYPDGRCISLTI